MEKTANKASVSLYTPSQGLGKFISACQGDTVGEFTVLRRGVLSLVDTELPRSSHAWELLGEMGILNESANVFIFS